jgi:hypothetical protein
MNPLHPAQHFYCSSVVIPSGVEDSDTAWKPQIPFAGQYQIPLQKAPQNDTVG